MIVTSKVFYNIKAKKFRQYLLENFFIQKLFELAPVRREIFIKSNDKAIAPSAVLFYKYAHRKKTDLNRVLHCCLKPNRLFSLFKIFVLHSTDLKEVTQKNLKHDELWKILVFGNYLDFNFIKRLNTAHPTIHKTIEDKKWLSGHGFQYGADRNSASKLIGLPFIESKNVNSFIVDQENLRPFENKLLHRVRDVRLYQKNKLLIRKAVTNELKIETAFSYKEGVFKDTFVAIKVCDKRDLKDLRIISGLFWSKLFAYYILQTGSSIGIEREQGHGDDRFEFPFIQDSKIASVVEALEKICSQIHEEKKKAIHSKLPKLLKQKEGLISRLDRNIFQAFRLNEQEIALVEYANDITIPLIMKHDRYEEKTSVPIVFKNSYFDAYIKVFFELFDGSFDGKHLEAEIWYSSNVVGIFFKIVLSKSKRKEKIVWKSKEEKDLLEKISLLGVDRITDRLFIQKDIRGFEKKEFYIIKPNEMKLWHKAIGYLDADNFMDAILKAGKLSCE